MMRAPVALSAVLMPPAVACAATIAQAPVVLTGTVPSTNPTSWPWDRYTWRLSPAARIGTDSAAIYAYTLRVDSIPDDSAQLFVRASRDTAALRVHLQAEAERHARAIISRAHWKAMCDVPAPHRVSFRCA